MPDSRLADDTDVNKSTSQQSGEAFRRVTYYLRPDQIKALKLRAVTEERNLSEVVRDAVDGYLAKPSGKPAAVLKGPSEPRPQPVSRVRPEPPAPPKAPPKRSPSASRPAKPKPSPSDYLFCD